MSQVHRIQHPMLEIIHSTSTYKTVSQVDHRVSQADLGRVAIHAVAGARAFREYNWLRDVPAMNASGNFRGMVVSAKWRAVFRQTSDLGKAGTLLQNIGLLAGFAGSIAEAAPQLEAIINSSDSRTFKGLRMTAIAGTAAQRALIGAIPAGTHAIYRSLEGWCMMAGLAGGKFQSGATQCISTLEQADTLVQSSFKLVTDTQNQAEFLWWVIDTVLFPRSR